MKQSALARLHCRNFPVKFAPCSSFDIHFGCRCHRRCRVGKIGVHRADAMQTRFSPACRQGSSFFLQLVVVDQSTQQVHVHLLAQGRFRGSGRLQPEPMATLCCPCKLGPAVSACSHSLLLRTSTRRGTTNGSTAGRPWQQGRASQLIMSLI